MTERGAAPTVSEQQLAAATTRFRKAEQAMKERRAEVHAAIVEAVASGLTVSEVARRTGYTREYVSKICDRTAR